MEFRRLQTNSEKLLYELLRAENPVQVLCAHFENTTQQEDDELMGVIKELRQEGYIDVKWADNVPCFITFNNSARTYNKRLAEYETQSATQPAERAKVKNIIFISHRSTDKDIADMLVDFFAGTEIPKEAAFCSSLPGNDINERISDEVKAALKSSSVNIAILSRDYYQSTYCLNEAGILWYEDIPVIPIAMPEINSGNMYGFLNNEYKLRRLDCDTDISYIYDTVSEAVSAPHIKSSIIIRENNKLREKYGEYLQTRELSLPYAALTSPVSTSEITTDDERIVLYYILLKNVRKVSKPIISNWLNEAEIYNINVDNAFDLLSSFNGGAVSDDTLEFGIEVFRRYSISKDVILPELRKCVEQHTKLAVTTFRVIWDSNTLDSTIKLFLAYIIDERMQSFGDRWMADMQIESIKQWENKNTLDSVLSSNYGSCLGFFVQNDLVYASSWTSYGNTREYTLCPSLQEFLFSCPEEIVAELQKVKDAHYYDLPF